MKKLISTFAILLALVVLLAGLSVKAATRPMFLSGTAIILMQGVSASGGLDPEPQALYDAIAMAPTGQPGGQSKVIKTALKDFTLACGYRGVGVACNLTVKTSERSRVDGSRQLAEISVDGAEAKEFYEKFAGPSATAPFIHETADKWVRIESTPERFYFRFTTTP